MRRFALPIACLLAACSFKGGGVTADAGDAPPVVTLGFAEAGTLTDELAGTTMVRVVLSTAATGPVTTQYRVSGGTAIRDVDYTIADGDLLFIPGSLEQTIPLTILTDAMGEPDETIELELVAWNGAELGTRTHTVTINANVLPRVSFTTASSSGDETAATAIDVVLDMASPLPITVDYTLTGTATSADYTLASGTVTFAANSTTAQMLVLGEHGDGLDEDAETAILTLGNPTNALIGTTAERTHTLLDVDAEPTVAFATPASTLTEEQTTITLTVALSTASGKTVTVPFAATGASTAVAPSDYAYSATPLIFAPGTTTQTITIALVDDLDDEVTETIVTRLGVPTNASLVAPTSHQLTVADDELTCFGTGTSAVCLDSPPTGTVALNGTLNTTTDARCLATQPIGWTGGQPAACFVVGSSISVATLAVVGARPLVLVANTIAVTGTLDAASHRGGTIGPASPSTTCAAFVANPAGGNGGGAGGAGGSFVAEGGDGGSGDGGNRAAGRAAAADAAVPTTLRGGCNGQLGGNGGSGNLAGAIGRGGGVVYLVAGTSITLTGVIDASGSAGSGGAVKTGGSGAGSGGMIKLHAPTITATGARLLANGGGGASGAQNSGGGSGFDPVTATPTTPAAGGNGEGGDGGDGFAGATAAENGQSGSNGRGGGGGGGGGGYIQANVALTGAVTSAGVVQAP